jgi:hypothetical protein
MPANRPSPRFALSLMSALLLVAVAASGAIAQSASSVVPPDTSVEAPAASPDPTDGAIPAVPSADIVDPHPTPWTRIDVAPDGRTLTVYFWNGAAACNGLKDVRVTVVDGLTTVTVLTGLTPQAMFTTCVEALFEYKTVVGLDAPILGGGTI